MKEFPTYFTGEHALSMTIRDYFASKALQSIITDGKLGKLLIHDEYIKKVSEMSYEYADAMMKAREK